LTSENTNAPWINLEAGAIAKTLESRVSALMINIKTSDIQGPLKRYQATKLEKSDFYQLIQDINKASDNPLSYEVLETAFNAIWSNMSEAINKIIDSYSSGIITDDNHKDEPIEEILQLLRRQNVVLTSLDQIIPHDYLLMF
jgi:hypothetical protein